MKVNSVRNYNTPMQFGNSVLIIKNPQEFPKPVLQALHESPAINQFLCINNKKNNFFQRIIDFMLNRKGILSAEYKDSVLPIGEELASGIKFCFTNKSSKSENKSGYLFGYTNLNGSGEDNLINMLRKMNLEFFKANVNMHEINDLEKQFVN